MVLLDKVEELTFCEGMAKEDFGRLFAAGEFQSYLEGSYIFQEGLHCDHVFLLCEGEVALEVSLPGSGPVEILTVGPGELLGWSPLLGLGWMTASARALSNCQVLALDAKEILAMTRNDPRFGMELMRRVAVTLARRLNATRLQLLQVRGVEGQVVS